MEHMRLISLFLLGLFDLIRLFLLLFSLRSLILADIGLDTSFVDLLTRQHFQLLPVFERHQANVADIFQLLRVFFREHVDVIRLVKLGFLFKFTFLDVFNLAFCNWL